MPTIAYLRLLRVGTLFSPAADVVAGMCLVGAPWTIEAARGCVASVAAYAAGMVLNDHADRHQDAIARPERPIPAGHVAARSALFLGVALLTVALIAAPAKVHYAVIVALIVAYDYVLKRSVLVAALTMGTLRALNLLAGAVLLVPLPQLAPAAVQAAGLYAVYIVAVTLLGAYEDETRPPQRAVASVQVVPPIVATLAMLPLPFAGVAMPIAAVLAFAFLLRLRRYREAWDLTAIRGSMRFLLLGTMAYTSLLCVGSGRWIEAAAVAGAALVARRISRAIALT